MLLFELLSFCDVDVVELDRVAFDAPGGALLDKVLSVLALVLLVARISSDVNALGPVSDQSPRSRNRLKEQEDCFSDLSEMMSVS